MDRKLTGAEAQKVKGLIAQGERLVDIAQEMNLSKGLVKKIKRGRRYKDCIVPDRLYILSTPKKDRFVVTRAKRTPDRRLDVHKVTEIKALLANTTLSNLQIAKVFNVSRQAISSLHSYGHRTWESVPTPEKIERQSYRYKIPEIIVEQVEFCLKANVLTEKEIALAFELSSTYINDKHRRLKERQTHL